MSVLVTGVAGFIGSHVADRLLSRGLVVVGLDSFDPFYPRADKERHLRRALEHEGFTLVEGDIRTPSVLRDLPECIDRVVHLAALPGVRPSIARPLEYADVNVGGTVALLELTRERGIRFFVFASSSSVYGVHHRVPFSEDDSVDHPISPYAATKRAGELAVHAFHHLHGIDVLCLRFFTVYGPRQRPDLAIHKFARLMGTGEPIPVFGDGSTQRDYTFVEDTVDGVESALRYLEEHDNVFEIINLGESRTISLTEMIDTLARAMGVAPVIDRLPLQPGDVPRTCADITKARQLLGYDPVTPFEEGIGRFIDWLRQGEPT